MLKNDSELIEKETKLVKSLTGADLEKIELNDTGWTSRVYIVGDGKYVFKFPRTEEVKKEYVQEIKIYNLFEELDTYLQVPKVRWTHTDNDYFGYEGVVGTQFATSISSLDDEHKHSLGQDIGGFLRQLHKLSLENPHVMTINDEILQAQDKYKGCFKVLQANLSLEEIRKLDIFISQYMPKKVRELGENTTLCHGDLGYWNMILKADGSLGVIDFGDVGYYDTSKDFCGLKDEVMLNAALGVYGDSKLLRDKINIRQKFIPFIDLQYFAESEDQYNIDETLVRIKKLLLS